MTDSATPIHFTFRVNAHGGGHMHVVLFAGVTPGSLARSGGLVLRTEEWAALKAILQAGKVDGTVVTVEDAP
jgi:hypothetical protein